MTRNNKSAVLVASSKENIVIFHEKGQEIEHTVYAFQPKMKPMLPKLERESAYFVNGRYSGERSSKRGVTLLKRRVSQMIFRTFQSLPQSSIHVTHDQLESFGYKKEE
jgi:hypothetical protein